MATASHVRMPFRGRLARKVLIRGLGLPRRPVYSALGGLKAALHPGQYRERRRCVHALGVDSAALAEWRRLGYRRLARGELPGLEAALDACRAAFGAARGEQSRASASRKQFLVEILADSDFCAHPQIVRFAVSPPLLGPVSAYLDSVPVLASARLWWTPPGDAASVPTASQRFHTDHEDTTQLKLFVNVFDVDEAHGPLTFLPADASERVRAVVGSRRGRVSDADVERCAGPDAAVRAQGPAGSAVLVDTSRCLHYGSRHTRSDRLVLMIQYLRFHAPAESRLALRLPEPLAGERWSEVQRLALGLATP